MKNSTLKKLFTSILIIIGMFSFTLNAQIVYTDIPDVTLKCDNNCYKIYSLDLNNDGTPDFQIDESTQSSTFQYCNKCSKFKRSYIVFSLLNGNRGAVTSDNLPSALVQGSEIGSLLTWDHINYGGWLRMTQTGGCAYGYCLDNYSAGNWTTQRDRYIGLALISNNSLSSDSQTNYGWVRLSVSVNINQAICKIMDYAFESTPNKSIIAGDAGEGAIVINSPVINAPEENPDLNELRIAPNPVSGSTTISFSLPESGKISVRVYDLNGRLIKTLADRKMEKGLNQINWNIENATAGIYILRLQTSSSVQTRKLVVLK